MTGWNLRSAKWALDRDDVIAGIPKNEAERIVRLIDNAGGQAELIGADPSAGVDVSARATPTSRCPYCHEDAGQDPTDVVACASCLARHHEGCWDEAAQCSSCGASERLVPDGLRPPQSSVGLVMGVVGAVAGVALTAAGSQIPAASSNTLII